MSTRTHDLPAATDAVLAAALDAVITSDEHGCVLDLNPAAVDMFGHAPAEAVGRAVEDLFVPPRLRAEHRAGLARLRAGGPFRAVGSRTELMAMRADGQEFPVELTVTRTSEAPVRFAAWIRDLTERRVVEARSARRKTLLERAEQLAHIGSWAWAPGTGEVVWTDNLFRLFGYEPGEVTPSVALVLEVTRADDRDRLARDIEAAGRDGDMPPTEMRIVSARDGSMRHLRAGGAVEDAQGGGGRWLVGTVHDVTDQRGAERGVAAHLAVSHALTAWQSLAGGAPRLLGDLAQALDFAFAMLWLPQGDVLVPSLHWAAQPARTRRFESASRELRLTRGAGLPGRAWDRGEPVHLGPLLAERSFLRREALASCGLRDGIAVPAIAAGDVLAVIELFSHEDAGLTDGLLRSLTGIGYELGAFLTRRRGELKPPPVTARELEVLQLVAGGLSAPDIADRLYVSRATVKTHLENVYGKLKVSDRASAVAHALREGLIE